MRVEELEAAVRAVERMAVRPLREDEAVAVGTLVEVEEDGKRALSFLAPHGGGARLARGTVQVVTPRSPLGDALLGRRAGDDCEVALAGRTRELVLLQVA